MAKHPLPTAEELRQLLRYEPDTGKLFWLERTADPLSGKGFEARVTAFNKRFSGKEAGSIAYDGYLCMSVKFRNLRAHRVAWCICHGQWPSKHLDHIDGDRLNNRLANLREVSVVENAQNTKAYSTNTSGFRGVCYDKGRRKWRAIMCHAGRRYNLGSYTSPEIAAEVVRAKMEEIGGYTARHING